MKKNIQMLLAVILLTGSFQSRAQLLNTYNLYDQEGYIINPAFIGNNEKISTFLLSHLTMSDIQGAPKNLFFGVSGPISDNAAIGTQIDNNERGLLKSTSWVVSYAYTIQLKERQSLNFGVSGGMAWQTLDHSNIVAENKNDPAMVKGYYDKTIFEGNAGFIYRNNDFLFSASAPHIFQFYHHYVGYASYKYDIPNSEFTLLPNILFQTIPKNNFQFDAGVSVKYTNNFWISGKYRSNKNVVMSLGFDLKDLGLAYSYEINNSSLAHIAKSNHEIMLFYSFGKKKKQEVEAQEARQQPLIEKIKGRKKNEPENNTEKDLRRQIELLEQNIELREKLRKMEGDSSAGIYRHPDIKVIENATEMNELDNIAENGQKSKNKVKPGYYIVVSTVSNSDLAKKVVDKLKEKDIKASIVHDPSKGYYYIYTGISEDRDNALERMLEKRKQGFKDAWICWLK